MSKRCGTCKWSTDSADEYIVWCGVPVPQWLIRHVRNPLAGGDELATAMNRYDGEQCSTWEAKP